MIWLLSTRYYKADFPRIPPAGAIPRRSAYRRIHNQSVVCQLLQSELHDASTQSNGSLQCTMTNSNEIACNKGCKCDVHSIPWSHSEVWTPRAPPRREGKVRCASYGLWKMPNRQRNGTTMHWPLVESSKCCKLRCKSCPIHAIWLPPMLQFL